MKQIILILIGLSIFSKSFSQTIKIQTGTSISNLDWTYKGVNIDPLFKKTLVGYSVFAGLDYINKKYFNLSSNIGLILKGGKEEIQFTDQNGIYTGSTSVEKAKLDYLSINTTIDLKYPFHYKIQPFVSLGPRLDYLYGYSKHFDDLKSTGALKNIAFGFLIGGGLKYDLIKFQFGLRADYYLNLTQVADWTIAQNNIGGQIKDNTFTVNLTIGYKIK